MAIADMITDGCDRDFNGAIEKFKEAYKFDRSLDLQALLTEAKRLMTLRDR